MRKAVHGTVREFSFLVFFVVCFSFSSVLDQLSIVGKTALVMVVTVSLVVLCFAGWRFLPAVQGEVQISYTDEYRSELDRTKLELELVKNKLDAYKEAYPEGLSESRLHDLNERNDALRANC